MLNNKEPNVPDTPQLIAWLSGFTVGFIAASLIYWLHVTHTAVCELVRF